MEKENNIMASSDLMKKGQVPISCDLCEIQTKIDWKCINCDVLMCTKCKTKVHSKLKSAQNHTVVEIKEVGLHSIELDFRNIICQTHAGQHCCMFCMSCEHLVCPLCIAKDHKGHDFVPINEGYQLQLEKVKDGQKHIKINLDEVCQLERKIQEIRKVEHKKFTDAVQQIRDQNTMLKKAVDEYTEEIWQEINKKWDMIENTTEYETRKLISLKEELTRYQEKIKDTLNSTDVENVFQECQNLEKYKREPIKLSVVNFDSMPKFIPGDITKYSFGTLQEVKSDIRMTLLQKYTTNISDVEYLSVTSDDSLWISDQYKIHYVKPEGKQMKLVRSYDERICGMAFTPNQDLLLATFEPTLKEINQISGKLISSACTVEPLWCSAVHVSKDGKIFCGALTPADKVWPVSGRRVVIRMNSDGKQEQVYEYDKHNTRLFTVVRHLTSTSNGTLFAVDWMTVDWKGRVMVLGQNGDVLHVYTGHSAEEEPFTPSGITTTPSDNVIVSDYKMHLLHILNSIGLPITYYRSSDIGIHHTCSLCFSTSGFLYIGCFTEENSQEHANLYKVDIHGV